MEWPTIGVALQKNYVSVYLSVAKNGAPLLQSYVGKLGAQRSGHNNFSFEKYEDLSAPALSSLLSDAEKIFVMLVANRPRAFPGPLLDAR